MEDVVYATQNFQSHQDFLLNAQVNMLETLAQMGKADLDWASTVSGIPVSTLEGIVDVYESGALLNLDLPVITVKKFKPGYNPEQPPRTLEALKTLPPEKITLFYQYSLRQQRLLTTMAEIAAKAGPMAKLLLRAPDPAMGWLSESHGDARFLDAISGEKVIQVTASSEELVELCDQEHYPATVRRFESKSLRVA